MKRRQFREPNVECSGKVGDRLDVWVTFTNDLEHLCAKLKGLGYSSIRVKRFDFDQWRRQAELEVVSLSAEIAQTGRASFKPTLWQRLKRHLFDLFDGSCAYCECRVLHISYGEVEHYRPKRKPEEADRHPGYYWLAYTPANLLPCCQACNGARAKARHFPVVGVHASLASEVANEKPLLLNPYESEDDPRRHLEFLVPPDEQDQLALVRGLSERGMVSIAIYNLQRADLAQYRRERQRRFLSDYKLLFVSGQVAKRHALVRGAIEGREECSAACLAAFDAWMDKVESEFAGFRRQRG